MIHRFFFLFFFMCSATLADEGSGGAETPLSLEDRAQALGAKSAKTFLQTFQLALQGALKDGGPVHAVSYCNSEVPALSKEVEKTLPTGIEFKRTSRKLRNPRNRPDSHELEALTYFETQLTETNAGSNSTPAYYLQRVQENSQGEYRYYKPIKIKPACLTCHGDKGMMSASLKQILAERYPEDQATGYQPGELRGLLRVSIPDALLEKEVKHAQ